MVNVPSAYATLMQQMSSATGIPYNVITAQVVAESNFNPNAVSPAGAEGWLQFLPNTYNSVSTQAGVQPGTEFNPTDESKAYDVFMKQLLNEEGGNLRNALAAYNAGPANISAGFGYADSILSAAKTSNITVPSTGSASTTSSIIPNLSVSGIVQDGIDTVLKMLGLGSLKDMMERAALIILGFVLVIVGIKLLSGGSGQSVNVNTSRDESSAGTTTTRTVKTPVSSHKTTRRMGTGAGEAVEAAAVA